MLKIKWFEKKQGETSIMRIGYGVIIILSACLIINGIILAWFNSSFSISMTTSGVALLTTGAFAKAAQVFGEDKG